MASSDLKYNIAITLIPGVGDVLAKVLIGYCGSAEAVLKEKKAKLIKIPDIGPVTADSVINNNTEAVESAEQEIEFIEKHKIIPLYFFDEKYPSRLKHCPDSPLMLYYKGTSDLNASRILSVVGTRNASDYGKSACKKFVEELADKKIIIVSGLAYGIDICAHKTALKNNHETIGVLAHGLDRIYPATHKPVAEKMISHGGLLTEYTKETIPDRENFPKRNRIVAGIADATLVIESGVKGGSMLTAEIASTYNRDVFALPGRHDDANSKGCNFLIKTNRAALVESAADIEYMLGWNDESARKPAPIAQQKLFLDLKDEEKILVDILKENGASELDLLCYRSKFTLTKVSSILLNLEFAGLVKSLPGKMYQLN